MSVNRKSPSMLTSTKKCNKLFKYFSNLPRHVQHYVFNKVAKGIAHKLKDIYVTGQQVLVALSVAKTWALSYIWTCSYTKHDNINNAAKRRRPTETRYITI